MSACKAMRRDIDRAFLEEALSDRSSVNLQRHLAACQGCRSYYDRVMVAARLLESGGEDPIQPSSTELAWMETAILQRLGHPSAAVAWWKRALWGLVPAVAVAGAAVLFVRGKGAPDEFRSRGGSRPDLAVRAFCQVPSQAGSPAIRSMADDPGPQEVRDCPVGGSVMFAVSSPAGGRLIVLRRDTQGKVMRLVPIEPAGAPMVLGPASQAVPVPLRVSVDTLDPAGTEIVFVLADRSLDLPTVEAAARDIREPGALGERIGATVFVRSLRSAAGKGP